MPNAAALCPLHFTPTDRQRPLRKPRSHHPPPVVHSLCARSMAVSVALAVVVVVVKVSAVSCRALRAFRAVRAHDV